MLTAAGVLCLAATGTAATVTWAAPSASPAQAADMLSFHSLTRSSHAETRAAGAAGQSRQAGRPHLDGGPGRGRARGSGGPRRGEACGGEACGGEACGGRGVRRPSGPPGGVPLTQAAAQQAATETAVTRVPSGTPQRIAVLMLVQYGWAGQFSCLNALWAQESGWNVYAENPSSGAYGIPQALPGSKMASAGAGLAVRCGHPDQLGPRLHTGHVRVPVRRLEPRGGGRLVLGRASRRHGRPVGGRAPAAVRDRPPLDAALLEADGCGRGHPAQQRQRRRDDRRRRSRARCP